MLYRKARPNDYSAMARIRASDRGEIAYWENRISEYLEGRLHPQKALAPRIAYVAEEETIIGFVAGHLSHRFDCEGELQWINVAATGRRAGIASELLRSIAHWFGECGVRRVCVDVAVSNKVARSFYIRHGAESLNDHWLVWPNIQSVKTAKVTLPDQLRRVEELESERENDGE
jgi:ribosomal protein S18 acetylase RimI-like enzyme